MWKLSTFLNAGRENVLTGKRPIYLQFPNQYPRLLNTEEDLLGCKHNKHIFKTNAQKYVSLPFWNTHIVAFLSYLKALQAISPMLTKCPLTPQLFSLQNFLQK